MICPRARADLHMANDLVPNSGDILFICHVQNVFALLLVPGFCEILIAIVHSARGLTVIFSPALILHRKCFQLSGDCNLIFAPDSKIVSVDQKDLFLLHRNSNVWTCRHVAPIVVPY